MSPLWSETENERQAGAETLPRHDDGMGAPNDGASNSRGLTTGV